MSINKTLESKNKINSKRKGEYIMEKTTFRKEDAVIATIILAITTLSGCASNIFRTDNLHATVTITTSYGETYVDQSVNGSNSSWSGKKIALAEKLKVNLKKGNTAHITFKCDTCGNEQEFDVDQPWSGVLSCDCPEKMNKDGNIKEYSAIEVKYLENVEEKGK